MRTVTITVSDAFYPTLMEFFSHVPDAKIEEGNIPEWHKDELDKRLAEYKLEETSDWKIFEDEMNKAYGV